MLGFHGSEARDELYFRLALAALLMLAITEAVLQRAVRVRQQFRLKTPDATIAATALEYDLTLITADQEFTRVSGLSVMVLPG